MVMKYTIPMSLVALVGGAAIADDTQVPRQRGVQVEAGRTGVEVDVNRNPNATTDARRVEGNDHAMRTSELVGLTVKNQAGDELGEIEDVVIDLNSGKIRYAAISMGGFLGIGDKLFAVPFDAITFRTHREDGALYDSTERVAMVNVNKEQMKNAEGFDQDHWPNMADRQWQKMNDRPYRTGARVRGDRRLLDR